MCWKSDRQIPMKVANENIPIYKILLLCYDPEYGDKERLYSIYCGFHYELDKTYRIEGTFNLLKIKSEYIKNTGFHSYNPEMTFPHRTISYAIEIRHKEKLYVLDRILERWCLSVAGYIPKGAFYYLNDKGEYVSNQICLTQVLDY